MAKYIDLTGQQIGKWTVLKRVGYLPKRGLHTNYLCECACGKRQMSTNLVRRVTYQCRTCAGKDRRGTHRVRLAPVFSRIKKGAKARGISLKINHAYALRLMEKQKWQCALTGTPLVVAWDGNRSSTSTASLDRIDSMKGYVPGNVQWVFKAVNMMKWKLTQEEFIRICHLVVKKNPRTL